MKKWQYYILSNSSKVLSASTTKESTRYNSFSLAIHTGDNIEKILENRDYFKNSFNKSLKFVTLKQVHSDKIINIDKYEIINGWVELPIEADGMVTTKRNIVLNILTADCLAIIAIDKRKNIIGAAHAGWRGTKLEISKKLIVNMQKLGAKIEDIKCAISPGICLNCYEVGQEVVDEFKDYPKSIKKKSNGKYLFDNRLVNIEQLISIGINKENIEIANFCTYCDNDKFFSYRKGDIKGRFVTYIGMQDVI